MKDAYVNFLIEAYDDYADLVSDIDDILIEWREGERSYLSALVRIEGKMKSFDAKREKACEALGADAIKHYLKAGGENHDKN